MDTKQFIDELMFTGNIVQDEDKSVSHPEREKRFLRYVELLDSLTGNEGLETAQVIIASMQAKHDYGAYQTVQRTLDKFPSEIYIKALILELPTLISNNSDQAGDLLGTLANRSAKYADDISLFKQHLALAENEARNIISQFIKEQEKEGWLEQRTGVFI